MAPASRAGDRTTPSEEERRDFRSYAWGIALALLLTLVPFALVHWAGVRPFPLILFSTLVLIIMVGGTVWIMGSLALRMVMPGQP